MFVFVSPHHSIYICFFEADLNFLIIMFKLWLQLYFSIVHFLNNVLGASNWSIFKDPAGLFGECGIECETEGLT